MMIGSARAVAGPGGAGEAAAVMVPVASSSSSLPLPPPIVAMLEECAQRRGQMDANDAAAGEMDSVSAASSAAAAAAAGEGVLPGWPLLRATARAGQGIGLELTTDIPAPAPSSTTADPEDAAGVVVLIEAGRESMLRVEDSPLFAVLPHADPLACLILVLLHECCLGLRSRWHRYLASLPQAADMHEPLFWSDMECMQLRGLGWWGREGEAGLNSNAADVVTARYIDPSAQYYQLVMPFVQQHGHAHHMSLSTCTLALHARVVGWVLSRAFRPGGDPTAYPLLTPMIDLCNMTTLDIAEDEQQTNNDSDDNNNNNNNNNNQATVQNAQNGDNATVATASSSSSSSVAAAVSCTRSPFRRCVNAEKVWLPAPAPAAGASSSSSSSSAASASSSSSSSSSSDMVLQIRLLSSALPLRAGQQLYFSYGPRLSNASLLARYGFVEGAFPAYENPYDTVQIDSNDVVDLLRGGGADDDNIEEREQQQEMHRERHELRMQQRQQEAEAAAVAAAAAAEARAPAAAATAAPRGQHKRRHSPAASSAASSPAPSRSNSVGATRDSQQQQQQQQQQLGAENAPAAAASSTASASVSPLPSVSSIMAAAPIGPSRRKLLAMIQQGPDFSHQPHHQQQQQHPPASPGSLYFFLPCSGEIPPLMEAFVGCILGVISPACFRQLWAAHEAARQDEEQRQERHEQNRQADMEQQHKRQQQQQSNGPKSSKRGSGGAASLSSPSPSPPPIDLLRVSSTGDASPSSPADTGLELSPVLRAASALCHASRQVAEGLFMFLHHRLSCFGASLEDDAKLARFFHAQRQDKLRKWRAQCEAAQAEQRTSSNEEGGAAAAAAGAATPKPLPAAPSLSSMEVRRDLALQVRMGEKRLLHRAIERLAHTAAGEPTTTTSRASRALRKQPPTNLTHEEAEPAEDASMASSDREEDNKDANSGDSDSASSDSDADDGDNDDGGGRVSSPDPSSIPPELYLTRAQLREPFWAARARAYARRQQRQAQRTARAASAPTASSSSSSSAAAAAFFCTDANMGVKIGNGFGSVDPKAVGSAVQAAADSSSSAATAAAAAAAAIAPRKFVYTKRAATASSSARTATATATQQLIRAYAPSATPGGPAHARRKSAGQMKKKHKA